MKKEAEAEKKPIQPDVYIDKTTFNSMLFLSCSFYSLKEQNLKQYSRKITRKNFKGIIFHGIKMLDSYAYFIVQFVWI